MKGNYNIMISRDEGLTILNGELLNIACVYITCKKEKFPAQYHYHKYNEFIYFLSGDVISYINDEEYYCHANDAILIHSGESHKFLHTTDSEYIVIKFLSDILSTNEQTLSEFEYTYNISNILNKYKHTRVISNIPELKSLALDAMEHFSQDEYGKELFIRADTLKICAYIINLWHKNSNIIHLSDITSKENMQIIKNIVNCIADESGNIKAQEAAKICGFSDGHFSRLFKSILGISFTDYTKAVRINEAANLLKCTNDSITEVAQKLGYSSSSHFISDFKKEKGMSPKQYRSNYVSI